MAAFQNNILIVDDDENLSRLLARLLQMRQYGVDIAHSGQEAMEKVQRRPDLVLLDLNLPDMEGLEICRRIREDKRFSQIPIIILSGRDAVSEKVEGLYVGADDYVTKPYEDEELIARVEAVLRRSQIAEYVVQEKENLIQEVKRIIQEADIKTFFQPIFSWADSQPLGFEVLSRPPAQGKINNAEFLFRAALSYGMYFELEMVCWKKAFSQWKQAVGQGRLFMNCMPYLVEHEQFDEHIFQAQGIASHTLVLEMTERMAIRDYVIFKEKTKSLKDNGLQIAIDDVGNGYASLDTIAETEPNYVKIDMYLVRDIQESRLKQGIVESIVTFCRKNAITTIAEGIEKKDELQMIRELGVDAVQGYFVGAPQQHIPASFEWPDRSSQIHQ